jgi:hypothetical protein
MNKVWLKSTFSILLLIWLQYSSAQYSDYKAMSGKIAELGKKFPAALSVKSLVKTSGGKDVLLISIGTGERDNKPGIAVFAGVDGSYMLGRELALGFATRLLNDQSAMTKELLSKVTFYVFPDVSPDASEQFFSSLRYERTVNTRATDDDRDFKTNEDPFEDLNKDGIITKIRVEDPAGNYITSADDERIMEEADLSKGKTGRYLLYSEGIDNDNDGRFNEDGEGGVNFNRNFTYNYEEFGQHAGLHAVSEPETKAVADFLFDRFNIYAVFVFGPQDNLGQPFKSNGQPNGDRRITSIMKSDEIINKLVSDKYHEITGMKGAPSSKLTEGNFLEWAYYHYGRYSFGTPGWWFPVEKGKNPEAEFMKYAGKNKMDDVFVPWRIIDHPGFPGKKVEAGGIKPYVMLMPPADSIEAIQDRHYRFITEIAAMHPELEIIDLKTENAGDNIFRISLKVHNKGVFATVAEAGDMNSWTRIMRIGLEPSKDQNLLSGLKVQRIMRLEGGDTAEFSWLIQGKGSLKITAGAVNTGIATSTVELR